LAWNLANYGSATGGLAAADRSSVWSRNGTLLVRLDAYGAGIAIATERPDEYSTKTVTLSRP
jgi:hypothetical protein